MEPGLNLPVKHNPNLHELVWELLRSRKPGKLLDVPSGPGYFAQQAATNGFDAVAAEIVDRLAVEVVALARAALTRLDLLEEPAHVVLGGGLLQSGDVRLLRTIEAGLREVGPQLVVDAAVSPPIVGSALLGLDDLGAGPAAQERLRRELGEAVERFETREEVG